MEHAIENSDVKIYLARDTTVTIGNQYIIDHDGKITKFEPFVGKGSSGAVIAIIVVLVIMLIIAGIFILRKVSRRMRFDRYFHFRNMRAPTSSIVRNHDTAPFVEQEFFEDGLDTMEAIGNQDGNLELRVEP